MLKKSLFSLSAIIAISFATIFAVQFGGQSNGMADRPLLQASDGDPRPPAPYPWLAGGTLPNV